MSLPQLVRNLRRERHPMIVYDRKATTWKDIFKKHPIENPANEKIFYEIEHCREFLGDKNSSDPILVLRSGYTWGVLRKIAENSLSDCLTFYEVAQKIMLNKKSIMENSIHNWFKMSLSALFLTKQDAPGSLNFFVELDEKNKEKALATAFQYYGENAYVNFINHPELKIEKFQEKLILWYWDADARQHNFIDRVLDEIKKKNPLVLDCDYIAENLKPNNLLKYQTIEINKRFISLDQLKISSARVNVSYADHVCLLQKKQETSTVGEVFDLLKIQKIIKELSKIKREEKYPKLFVKNKPAVDGHFRFFDGKKYSSILEVFYSLNGRKIDLDSMVEFVEKNLEIEKEDKRMPNIEFWQEAKTILMTIKLNDELPQNKIKAKKTKI